MRNGSPLFALIAHFISLRSITTEKTVLLKWRPSDFDSKNPPQEIEFDLYDNVDFNKVAPLTITDTSSFITFDQDRSPFENNPGWHQVASEASNERFIVMNPDKVPTPVKKWMASKVNSEDFVKFTLEDWLGYSGAGEANS